MTDCRIENVGIEDFDVEPDSVDLILTDPPYPREYLWTWTALGEFAGRVLKPGGSLLAMSGQMFLPTIMDDLAKHLDFVWMIGYVMSGPNARLWQERLYGTWKPFLWYAKGKPTAPRKMTRDSVVATGRDKRFHKWGQDLGTFDHLTRSFSRRGDLVCDPFLGGGTTALAVLVNGRRFIGCDVDPRAIALTTARLDALDDYRRARLTHSPVTATPSSTGDRDERDPGIPEEGHHEQEDQRAGSGDCSAERDGRPRPGQGRVRGGGEAGEARRPDAARDGRVDDVPEGEEGSDVPDRRAGRRRARRDAGGDGNGAGGEGRGEPGRDARLGRTPRGRGEAGPEAAEAGEAGPSPQAEGRSDCLASTRQAPEDSPPASLVPKEEH